MKLIQTVSEMQAFAYAMKTGYKSIGFVPTMGYLHNGHLAFIDKCKEYADITVASIFVNPTQFAPNEDLERYPRDLEGDKEKLISAGCDVLFLPNRSEIYQSNCSTIVKVEGITTRYEGTFRPDHFSGVTTIVTKLFNMVQPQVVVFGQKDAQQVAVIKRMIIDLNYEIKLIVHETIREYDGLALSSRNIFLNNEDRTQALTIYKGLQSAKDQIQNKFGIEAATKSFREILSNQFIVDYADIVNPDTFELATENDTKLMALFAGKIGTTRLIDNLIIS